jgi:methylglutaconyl-CoA hydratase
VTADRPLVGLRIHGDVATVRLDSPHNRNALSRRLLVELDAALATTQEDAAVRVVVLTGADPVFCAGADVKEARDGQGPGPVSLVDVLVRITEHRCPVVARVNGPARAGGLGLLAACDIAVGLRQATYAFSEVRIGVVPAVIAVPVLQRMHASAAHELFLTGDTFDGGRAAEVGLLNHAVETVELDATIDRVVGMLQLGGPEALTATKKLRRQVAGRPTVEAFAEMLELSHRHFASPEGQAGIAAQREKRPAPWVPDGF